MISTWMRPLVFGVITICATFNAHAQENAGGLQPDKGNTKTKEGAPDSKTERSADLKTEEKTGSRVEPTAGSKPVEAPQKYSDPLDKQIDEAIETSSRRILTAGVHTPWQILHGILALRQNFRLKQDGKYVSALDWLASGTSWKRMPLFEVTRYGGRAHTFTKPYDFEGHPNQFLAILTMSNLPMNHQFKANGGNANITIAQMVKNAQMTVNDEDEVTWTLWALSHYLDTDAAWRNERGEYWSIERLVQVQTHDSVLISSCGGTHGMFALSRAYQKYLKTGKPVRGVWFEADQKIKRHIATARSLQNRDGTFSTNHFDGSGFSQEFNTRVSTTGHMLEWIMVALPAKRLKEDWVRRAIAAIASDLLKHRNKTIECGPLYHALDALVVYRERTRPDFNKSLPQNNLVKKAVPDDNKTAKSKPESSETKTGVPPKKKSQTTADAPKTEPKKAKKNPKNTEKVAKKSA